MIHGCAQVVRTQVSAHNLHNAILAVLQTFCFQTNLSIETRMHSSRMHTTCSSSRPEQAPPPPPTWSPSTSPLAVGLDQTPSTWRSPLETCCKACWDTTCNVCWHTTLPPHTHTETCCKACWDTTTPCRQTHTCKHITLPQTSFAGGNYTRQSEINKLNWVSYERFLCLIVYLTKFKIWLLPL